MFAYNPTVNNQSGAIRGAGAVNAANTQAASTMQVGQDIGKALDMVGRYFGAKKQASAFDTAMGAAKESGLINQDTLDMFMNVPWQEKAQVFSLFQGTVFPIQAQQQKVAAQADAWAQYRGRIGNGGGSGGGGNPDEGFVF